MYLIIRDLHFINICNNFQLQEFQAGKCFVKKKKYCVTVTLNI